MQLPAADQVVVRRLLERNAEEYPSKTFVTFDSGEQWTFRDALHIAYGAANALRDYGVGQGDRVGIFLPNGPDFLRAWWGTSVLGAAIAPINTAFKGAMLGHAVNVSSPKVVISETALVPRFDGCDIDPTIAVVSPEILDSNDSNPPNTDRPIRLSDSHALMLTSGTTGKSKLSDTTYLNSYLGGSQSLVDYGAGPDDVFLIDLPLFHLAALYHAHASMRTGTGLAVRSAPDLDRYWEVVGETNATMAIILSTMVTDLLSKPVREAERRHGMWFMFSAPLPPHVEGFMERFGVSVVHSGYGSTEVPGCINRKPGQEIVEGSCGRVRDGFEVRLVDDLDFEVQAGEAGEAMVRTEHPWMLTAGYVSNAEATAAAWRNGWFHTGDLLRRDDDGNYYFVDRKTDALRRKGENISTFEVEREVLEYPGIVEAACVGERSAVEMDDEVKVWIVTGEDARIDYVDLMRFLVDRMPYYMVPRYLEKIETLPKTEASARVRKYELRERGHSKWTWDRKAHGVRVSPEGMYVEGIDGQ